MKMSGAFKIFKKVWGLLGLNFKMIYFLDDIKNLCFTIDNNFIVWFTQEPNETLCTFSLQTGATLRSISGLYPISYVSNDRRHFGYIFRNANEC